MTEYRGKVIHNMSKIGRDEEPLLDSIRGLDTWVNKNGWAGYDPYALSEKIYSTFGRNRGGAYMARILRLVGRMTGITHTKTILKLLRVKQYLDPATFIYLGKGYLLLHRMTGEGVYLRLARDCGDWLIADTNKRGEAMWGHPFVWYTVTNNYFHKKNNPNLFISSLAAHFLLDLYDETKETRYRQMVEQTCEEVLSIPYYVDDAGRICFWYIRDRQELPIHNGNIYTASLLLRAGSYPEKRVSSSRLIKIAQGAIQYHLCHQNADGSWYYFGPPISNRIKTIDNNHTGFNLDAMKLCYDIMPEAELRQGILKGASFYETMFDNRGASFPLPTKKYPVQVHDLAQGIQTFSLLGEFSDNYLNLAKKIATYAIKNMQNKDGSFSYAQLNKVLTAKLPYMRNSQAPMFRALCELLSHLRTKNAETF